MFDLSANSNEDIKLENSWIMSSVASVSCNIKWYMSVTSLLSWLNSSRRSLMMMVYTHSLTLSWQEHWFLVILKASNMLNFAFMAVFQSIFQCCQHHVNTVLAAVTSHKSHTKHLKRPKSERGEAIQGCYAWIKTQHFLPSQQMVRVLRKFPSCVFSWCRLWSLSSHIHEEEQ